ncbi:MAG: hypothetical protein RIG82_12550 [Phycisphaeraceae bacterium]
MILHLAIAPDNLDVLRLVLARQKRPNAVIVCVGASRTRRVLDAAGLTPNLLISPPLGSPVIGYPRMRKIAQTYPQPLRVIVWSDRAQTWAQWLWPGFRIDNAMQTPIDPSLLDLAESLQNDTDPDQTRAAWQARAGSSPETPFIGLLTDHAEAARTLTFASAMAVYCETHDLRGPATPKLVIDPELTDRPAIEGLWTRDDVQNVLLQEPDWLWPWRRLPALDAAIVPAGAREPGLLCSLALQAGCPVALEVKRPDRVPDDLKHHPQLRITPEGAPKPLAEALLDLVPYPSLS